MISGRHLTFFPVLAVAAALLSPGQVSAGARANWEDLTDAIAVSGNTAAAARLEEALSNIPDEELERVYGNADLPAVTGTLSVSGKALDSILSQNAALKAAVEEAKPFSGAAKLESAGLPVAVGYPTPGWCPFSPDRSNADQLLIAQDVVATARVALETAKEVFAGVDRVCKEVIVILGEGGNTSLACIPADIVLAIAEFAVGAAETVIEHIDFCDAAVDAAEIEGTYERASHIHSDLSAHDTAISTQVSTHDTNIVNNIASHDLNITTKLAAHDADIKSQLAMHDADMKALLAQHDADIKALLSTLQATVDENQRLITVTMSRQLEVLRLLITPSGRRELNPAVLDCTGPDCPQVADLMCADGSLSWACKPKK